MATAIRPIGHEDRLSLVDHLDELRTRLIVSAVALAVAFGVCLWQNHALLHIINKPLKQQTQKQVAKGTARSGRPCWPSRRCSTVARSTRRRSLRRWPRPAAASRPRHARAARARRSPRLQADVAKIPRVPQGDKPVTLGIGEPFTTTLTVTLAVRAGDLAAGRSCSSCTASCCRRSARASDAWSLPLLARDPVCCSSIGVLFGYFVVLPAAVRFFQNFNSSEFNVLVQASQYYRFAATVLLAMGLVFQVPVAILAATRVGHRHPARSCATTAATRSSRARRSPRSCRATRSRCCWRRVPLYVLYEASILLASLVERRERARERQTAGSRAAAPRWRRTPSRRTEPSVQQIIDHTDSELSADAVRPARTRPAPHGAA